MAQGELDTLTNEIEQGFMQQGGWKACRYLLGKLLDCRAGKLLIKGKPFIVVAHDEPYFTSVYLVIREAEKHKGRWTADCEQAFQEITRYDHEGEFPEPTPELASILRDQIEMNEMRTEVERLKAELAWCHHAMDRAHEELNSEIPAPEWSTVYQALEDAKATKMLQ